MSNEKGTITKYRVKASMVSYNDSFTVELVTDKVAPSGFSVADVKKHVASDWEFILNNPEVDFIKTTDYRLINKTQLRMILIETWEESP